MQEHELAKLVEAHHGAVVAVAYAVTRDLALAEDVAQETFVAAWGDRAKLREAKNVRAWLCGIARNQARNQTRRRWREVGGEHADAADPEPSVLVGAALREQTSELRAALDEIPETYREPLVLFYWQDKSIAQVASALEISEEAAQKRLSRARAYLKNELEAPLEQQGRGRRSAAAAAAAVLALLAAQSSTASAAGSAGTSAKGASMVVKAFGVLAAAGLAVGAVAMVRGGSSDASPTSASVKASEQTAAPVAVASAKPTGTPPPALPAKHDDVNPGISAAKGRLPVPDEYEITVLGPTAVAVELAGGKSQTYMPSPKPAPGFARHITGKIVDAAQKPVAGAVIVISDRLGGFNGSLMGSSGAKTGLDGTFDAVVHDEAAAHAIVLHPRGWSATLAVPGGASNADLGAVAIGSPGTISVHVKQGGVAREADVILHQDDRAMLLTFETDAKGDLVLPLLGAGTYRLEVRPTQMFAGGTSDPVVRDVTLAPSATSDLAIDLPTGALVVASAFNPGMQTVEYWLYAGSTPRDYASLRKAGRSGQMMNFLLGGQDADRGAEFHDILPGAYMLCVNAKDADAGAAFKCQPVEVPPGKDTLEVAVDVGALAKEP